MNQSFNQTAKDDWGESSLWKTGWYCRGTNLLHKRSTFILSIPKSKSSLNLVNVFFSFETFWLGLFIKFWPSLSAPAILPSHSCPHFYLLLKIYLTYPAGKSKMNPFNSLSWLTGYLIHWKWALNAFKGSDHVDCLHYKLIPISGKALYFKFH